MSTGACGGEHKISALSFCILDPNSGSQNKWNWWPQLY
jgi:hypothetical protein